ncbi:MAG TPA: hypothetical protein VMT63_05745 [Bacteroidales bacterium]|nr:hypothetical protein [Bacteroidales bacterium]
METVAQKPKKKFRFDEFSYSLLKANKWFAVYAASESSATSAVKFYQIFRIADGELVLNRYGRYRYIERVFQEYRDATTKILRKLTTTNNNEHGTKN